MNATSATGQRHAQFRALTEIGGMMGSPEQVARLTRRYQWAADFCRGRDVAEVACGAGIGLGVLASVSRSLIAGDLVAETVQMVSQHYGTRVRVECFGAEQIPAAGASLDVVIAFEAIYYFPSVTAFFVEAARVLRPGGILLIATANKDVTGFTPSQFSVRYLGVAELTRELSKCGYVPEFYGDVAVSSGSIRQRVLMPVKRAATAFGLVPSTLKGREWLKRLFFGGLIALPAEITEAMFERVSPPRLDPGAANSEYKVVLCAARRSINPVMDTTGYAEGTDG